MKEKLNALLKSAISEIEGINERNDLESIRVKYLGKKGELTSILKQMGTLSAEERPVMGQIANKARDDIEAFILERSRKIDAEAVNTRIKSEKIDVTLPAKISPVGRRHPIAKAISAIEDVFVGMGFDIAEGFDIEYAYYNFTALNTPAEHPARDLQDTFYIDMPDAPDEVVLRTQTSSAQIRFMQSNKPPIRMVCPGRVYRSDSIDATHSPMFHQLEGLVVDKNITFGDLRGAIEIFVANLFSPDTKTRFRPHHFPFTEPSAEADISCFVCGGKGCSLCKGEGWIEILGCGMVHPKVLAECGIDPEIYSGFAFGFGIDRIVMAMYGIEDLRYLFENDVRFLRQF